MRFYFIMFVITYLFIGYYVHNTHNSVAVIIHWKGIPQLRTRLCSLSRLQSFPVMTRVLEKSPDSDLYSCKCALSSLLTSANDRVPVPARGPVAGTPRPFHPARVPSAGARRRFAPGWRGEGVTSGGSILRIFRRRRAYSAVQATPRGSGRALRAPHPFYPQLIALTKILF